MSSFPLPDWLAAEVNAVRGLASQPALRNLKITESYSEISRAFSKVTGAENVNWCTFAVWASKTAGQFIRMRDIQALLDLLHASKDFDRVIARLNRYLFIPLPDRTLIDLAGQIIDTTSNKVAEGNFQVYDELAPLFGQMLTPMDDATFRRFLDSLRPGDTAQGGQDLLRSAFTHYRQACSASGQDKAELILMASAQTGLHEQMRLQPYIAGSLNAPVDDILKDIVRKASRFPRLAKFLEPLVRLLRRPVVAIVRQAWLEFSTRNLMTLTLPGQTLQLGEDLPAPPRATLFPPELQIIRNPELLALLTQYHAAEFTSHGSGAKNWANLTERMKYIIELFRSRQQDSKLFGPPFEPAQVASIKEGVMPGGDL